MSFLDKLFFKLRYNINFKQYFLFSEEDTSETTFIYNVTIQPNMQELLLEVSDSFIKEKNIISRR